MEPTTEKTRWRDRVKNNIKANEIQKTVVSFWQEHREAIIIGGLCLATGTLVAKRSASINSVNTIDGDGNVCTSITAEQITNVTHNHAPKRLSYIVTDGDRWWQTQRSAAKDLGVTQSQLSRHLNHERPLHTGDAVERVGVRS